MFEQEYMRANDRIHPRQDLLKDLQKNWEAEQAEEKKGRVVAFPTWIKVLSAAAGIILCVGIGMGSMLLLSRKGTANMSAEAEAPQMAYSLAEDAALNDAIRTEGITTATTQQEAKAEAAPEDAPAEALLEPEAASLLMKAAEMPAPVGMHRALDEEEIAQALGFASADQGGEAPEPEAPAAGVPEEPEAQQDEPLNGALPEAALAEEEEAEALAEEEEMAEPVEEGETEPSAADAPADTVTAAAAQPEEPASDAATVVPQGRLMRQGDNFAVFMPTTEQVHIVQYANNKLSNVFSLGLKAKGTQVKDALWLGDELLALRETAGKTELLRFSVADWKSPRHLKDMTQSGAFLAAKELGGRLLVLTRFEASPEAPLPQVDGAALSADEVLLDRERPGTAFALLTVYDPALGAFGARLAVLSDVSGLAAAGEQVLLWSQGETLRLFALSFSEDGLNLVAEAELEGDLVDLYADEAGYTLLLQRGEEAALVTLDGALAEQASLSVRAGALRCGEAYAGGAAFLTETALHVLTPAGDRALELNAHALRRLTEVRLLAITADGTLHLVGTDGELRELSSALVKEDMTLILEAPAKIAFEEATGRIAFPAGKRVYQFMINDKDELRQRGYPLSFGDHNEQELRELRCLLLEDRAIVFYKAGAMLCNVNLERMLTNKY